MRYAAGPPRGTRTDRPSSTRAALPALDRELVRLARTPAREASGPEARGADRFERVGPVGPAVALAEQRDRARVRRPHGEPDPVAVEVRAEAFVEPEVPALVEEVQVVGGESGHVGHVFTSSRRSSSDARAGRARRRAGGAGGWDRRARGACRGRRASSKPYVPRCRKFSSDGVPGRFWGSVSSQRSSSAATTIGARRTRRASGRSRASAAAGVEARRCASSDAVRAQRVDRRRAAAPARSRPTTPANGGEVVGVEARELRRGRCRRRRRPAASRTAAPTSRARRGRRRARFVASGTVPRFSPTIVPRCRCASTQSAAHCSSPA